MLSLSQPELDTGEAFDIPSPPPVAANCFDPGFSALDQPSVSSHSHGGAQEPLLGFDRADVPDDAPKAPIATIPELEMGAASSSEESIPARGSAPQSGLTPAATAQTEHQITPIDPTERPRVDLDPSGHEGAVSESSVWATAPRIDVHQRSAATEASGDASLGGNTSHDLLETPDTGGSVLASGVASTPDAAAVPEPLHQAADSRPEAGAAPAPAEVSAPEAVPPSAVPHRKSPRPANQDKVYGELYDSLFPQSFTSEVLSSLSSTPPHIFTQHSVTIVRTVDDYRTETSTPTYPSARSAAGRDESPAGPYVDRISVSGGSRLEAEPSKGSDVHSGAPPSSLCSRFESAAGGEQSEPAGCLSEGPLLHSNLNEDTPGTVLQTAAPPVSDDRTARGRDARVTQSVSALPPVRHVVRDQVSSQAVSLSAPENKPRRNPEWKTQTPAPPADMDGLVSPTYLSVGSDDGSAVDIYYSAEEDNSESADDEVYAVDEGGAQMGVGGGTAVASREEPVRRGDFPARDVSDGDEGMFSGMLVRRGGGEKTGEGQARGYSSKAHLRDEEKFVKVIVRVEDGGMTMREEKLLAKPVLQGNNLAVCDPVPPSAGKRGRLEDTQQIWAGKLETEESPKGEQRPVGQPLDYLSRKNGPSERQEVIIIARSTTTEKQVSIAAEAERSSEVGRGSDGRGATGAGADAAAAAPPLTGSLTHTGSAAEHNAVPQRAEWVDTITRSAGRSRNLEPEVQLHLSETHRTAAAPLSESSPEQPAGAQPDPSPG